jgi:hypothetical protein
MARKRGMPCGPCCGLTACGCSGLPTTLHGSYTTLYPGATCLDPFINGTISYTATYNPGSILIGGGIGTVTGYWDSGCVANPGSAFCFCSSPPSNGSSCCFRAILYCHGLSWRVAAEEFSGDPATAAAACAAYTGSIGDFGSLTTGQCSPFSWSDGGSFTYTS